MIGAGTPPPRPAAPAPTRRGGAGRRPALAVAAVALLAGCGVYSFSGASIPDHLQTVAVPIAEDQAGGTPPGAEGLLTDALVRLFGDRSRLSLVADEGEADAVVRATIERYAVAPAAVTGDDRAAVNRVTLAVRVVVRDRVEDRDLLDRAFTATEDYEPGEGLQGEADATASALEQVARDAFTAATSDW